MDSSETDSIEKDYDDLLKSLFSILRTEVDVGDRSRENAETLAEMIKDRLGIVDPNEGEGWAGEGWSGSSWCSY
jgi:hypothetical protein